MQRSHRRLTRELSPRVLALWACTVIAIALILFAAGCQSSPVPSDAQDFCPLDSATFNGWFQSGTASVNGVVNPANSLNNLVLRVVIPASATTGPVVVTTASGKLTSNVNFVVLP